jgi:anthranilate phosphoribosyltransferase
VSGISRHSWRGSPRAGKSLADSAFEMIMSGDATPSQMGAFLIRLRGETVDEIAGAARQCFVAAPSTMSNAVSPARL